MAQTKIELTKKEKDILRQINDLEAELLKKLIEKYSGKNVIVSVGQYAGRKCVVRNINIYGGKVGFCAPPYRLNPSDGSTLWERPDARTYFPMQYFKLADKE